MVLHPATQTVRPSRDSQRAPIGQSPSSAQPRMQTPVVAPGSTLQISGLSQSVSTEQAGTGAQWPLRSQKAPEPQMASSSQTVRQLRVSGSQLVPGLQPETIGTQLRPSAAQRRPSPQSASRVQEVGTSGMQGADAAQEICGRHWSSEPQWLSGQGQSKSPSQLFPQNEAPSGPGRQRPPSAQARSESHGSQKERRGLQALRALSHH